VVGLAGVTLATEERSRMAEAGDEEPTELRLAPEALATEARSQVAGAGDEEPTELQLAEALATQEERSARGVEVGAGRAGSDDARAAAAPERRPA
jgi:hypothetical protein